MTSLFGRRIVTALVIAIITGSTMVRFSLLPNSRWTGDAARDILVAKHIALYGERPNLGHVASGTNPISYYPPVYFSLLSLISRVHYSAEFILAVFFILNSISQILLYRIARNFTTPAFSLFSVLLFSTSLFYIERMTMLSSMHFSLPFFLLGIFLHSTGIRMRRVGRLAVGLGLLLVASSINYAALITIPVFYFWSFRLLKSVRARLSLTLILAGSTFLLFFPFARYIMTTYSPNAFFSPFYPSHYTLSYPEAYGVQALSVLSTMTQALFPALPLPKLSGVLILLFLVIPIFTKKWRQKRVYVLSVVVITLFFMMTNNAPTPAYYFYLIGPFLFLGISLSLETVWRASRLAVVRTVTLLLAFIIFSAVAETAPKIFSPTYFSTTPTFSRTKNVTMRIAEEIRSLQARFAFQDIHFYTITIHTPIVDHWEQTTLWYFLEETFGKMTTVSDRTANNLKITNRSDIVMVICRDYDEHTERVCQDRVRRNEGYALLEKISLPLPWRNVFVYQNTVRQSPQ